ncbi:LOW QUALITY PROTEIN: uncharacterized protein LOC134837008 [Culicoides brevitarsis]|uniref:LOW QUALITY PROTEIN: uncharacterized protein LOC134837008 n=1 Tax=Culicoides brevitarsis TaxID=469753 RepID=UPI00307BCEEB
MAKPISLNKFVGCDENNGNPTNPFNPDEDEFGDCLFNPDSDLKNNVSKKRNTIIVSPVKPVKRKKNEDSPVNHKKIESSPKIAPITKLPSKDMKIEPKIVAKPPLPPKPSIVAAGQKIQKSFSTPGSTPKMKRKVEEANNATLVQKLSAQSEQLRLEISLLKTALSQEKNAVRALRAQNEAESRRLKQDIKRLQDTIQNQKTSSLKKGLAPAPAKGNTETHQAEIARLNHEIVTLREAFKSLDDKYQSSLKAENQKLAELKDSYEQRLTQTSLSAKTEIQRLLEELKSKEHLLTQARDELSFNHKQREEETQHNEARFSQKMRKINEFEHINGDDDDIIDDHLLFDEESFSSSNSLTNGTKSQQTTCGMASLHETEDIEAQPHESPNNSFKETKININMANNKDLTRETSVSSDLDSALSSAPQSLSPQPQTCPNSPVVWPKERDKRIQEENEEITELLAELECARQQIKALEEELTELKNKDPSKKLKERCRKLEHQEAALTKELHEVREQNELLEFRIIELEEAHDKWSVRSNSTPSGTTKDVWTDTEKESEDIVMSERSDSGVTSPNNSHHHSEDQHSVSPCDLSLLDQLPTEEIRKRIREMSKRNCYDEDDKTCLMQVLSLLNNLEALSKDHDTISTRSSQSCTDDENTYKPSESETHHLRTLSLVTASPFKSQSGKIIATVQPFSSSNEDLYRSRSELPSAVQKKKSWINTSLQESGVFEGDPADFCTATTQTEPEDFPEKTNAELCAEIEKLNKFREKIEEFSTKKLPLLPPTEIERRLQYYRERVAVLENKVLVYESTGDTQTKHLADRLQREIQLESIVKQYSDKIAKLTRDFRRVEDERNELEEIENDTRLANQRIEEELEVMSQRNVELEISKDTYMEKYHEAKENVACLEECLQKCEERIFVLEEHENDLKHQLETITQFIPLVGVYCAWKGRESAMPAIAPVAPPMPAEVPQTVIQTIVEKCSCDSVTEKLQTRINELLAREKDLLQNISELNRAYNETLENADNLWAQMERDYKEKIFKYEEGEMNLKSKLAQLEDRLKHDSAYAQERITHLEESETAMKERISKLIKENKEILAKNAALLEECRHLKEEYTKLRQYVDGPAAEALEKEKRKIKVLEDELLMTTKMLKHTEEVHQDELSLLKTQLKSANKELTHTEVTNSELKEEVETLEAKIKELGSQRAMYEDKIKYLTEELKHKERAVKPPFLTERTLAQELARPIRRGYSSDSSDSSKRSTEFLDRIEEARPHREFRSVADTIIMNAETRACRATKRSFVEEARSRFARWV